MAKKKYKSTYAEAKKRFAQSTVWGAPFTITKTVVHAQPRTLSALWSYEVAQEAEAEFSLDVNQAIADILAEEIQKQIDADIVKALRQSLNIDDWTWE